MSQPNLRLSGWILILGFAALVVGALAAPAGAYDGSLESRQRVIEAQSSQWRLSKVFDGLAVVLPAVAFIMLAFQLRHQSGSVLSTIGGLAFLMGGVVGLVYVIQLATDPIPLYDRETLAPLSVALYSFFSLGLVMFGVAFIRAGLPAWVGWLAVVIPAAVLLTLLISVTGGALLRLPPEIGFLLGVLIYLVTLFVAVGLVRRP